MRQKERGEQIAVPLLVNGELRIDFGGPGPQSADDIPDDDWPIGGQKRSHPLHGQLGIVASAAHRENCAAKVIDPPPPTPLPKKAPHNRDTERDNETVQNKEKEKTTPGVNCIARSFMQVSGVTETNDDRILIGPAMRRRTSRFTVEFSFRVCLRARYLQRRS